MKLIQCIIRPEKLNDLVERIEVARLVAAVAVAETAPLETRLG